jgi:hypothetical protein
MSNKKGPNPLDSGLRFSGCAVAQFRNEDRIKISVETVLRLVSYRKNITSESALHRITQIAVRK